MENPNTRTVIRIQNTDYTIETNETEEFVQRIAFYINKKFDEVIERNKKLSTNLIATFTAVNLAEDYLRLNDEYKLLSDRNSVISKAYDKVSAENSSLKTENENLNNEIQQLKIKIAKLER